MMTIEIKINERVIARAEVTNVSDLADMSDYTVSSFTAEWLGTRASARRFLIRDHKRADGAWELARRIAAEVAGEAKP